MIKNIIFDFDGTIADSINLGIELYNELAEKYGFLKINKEDFEYLRNLSVIEKCKALHVPLFKLPVFGIEFMKNYRQALDSLKTFDGINEVIYELKHKGYRLNIISSNSHENVSEFLKKNGIDLFDSIDCINSIFGKDKAIRSFIKKHSVNKEELVYIGDENRDIDACKVNSIKCIAVSWGVDSIELLKRAGPDFIVSSPPEIIGIVGLNH